MYGGRQNLPRPALEPLHVVALELSEPHHEVFARLALKFLVEHGLGLLAGKPGNLGKLVGALAEERVSAFFNGFYFLDTALDPLELAVELSLLFIKRLLALKDSLLGAGNLLLFFAKLFLGLGNLSLAVLFCRGGYLFCLFAGVEKLPLFLALQLALLPQTVET